MMTMMMINYPRTDRRPALNRYQCVITPMP